MASLSLILRFSQLNVRYDSAVRMADLARTCSVGCSKQRSIFRSRLRQQDQQQAERYTFVPVTGRILSCLKAATASLQPSLVRRSPYTENVGSGVVRGLQRTAMIFLSFLAACGQPGPLGMPWSAAAAAIRRRSQRHSHTWHHGSSGFVSSLSGRRSHFTRAPMITTANTCYFQSPSLDTATVIRPTYLWNQEPGNMIKTTFHNVVDYHSGSTQIPTFA